MRNNNFDVAFKIMIFYLKKYKYNKKRFLKYEKL